MTDYEAILMRMKSETPFRSESDSLFYVQSRYVDFSRIPSLEIPTSIIKFSEEQYAISHSKYIKLATPSHFREIEEYRFVISLMGTPKEETLFLNVTDELRRLTQVAELSTFDGL